MTAPVGQDRRTGGSRVDDRTKPDIIVPLQFLRGLAACGVVVEHLLSRYDRRGALPADLPDFVLRTGETGVFAFFAISGFIMVHIALRRSGHGHGAAAGWHFLRDRFTRIVPLYYLTMLLYALFGYATVSLSTNATYRAHSAIEWLLSFLFIPYRRSDGLIQPIYQLGWTLQYEMFFYLLFAGGMAIGARRGFVSVIGVLTLLVLAGRSIAEPEQSIGIAMLAYVYTRPILLYFVIGMAVALLRQAIGHRLPTGSMVPLSAAAFVLFLIATTRFAVGVQMLAIGAALLTVTMVRARPEGSPRFARLALALGDASYAIYLTHSFLLGAFAALTARWVTLGHGALLLAVAMACAGCAVAGWLVWRFVEFPLTARLRGRRPNFAATVAP